MKMALFLELTSVPGKTQDMGDVNASALHAEKSPYKRPARRLRAATPGGQANKQTANSGICNLESF